MKSRRRRPLLIIDFPVPRDIDPAAGQLQSVTLHNIDDLAALTRHGAQSRERGLTTCHQKIEAHVAALIEKRNPDHERLSVEQRKDRWMPDPFATSLNLLPTAA